MLPLHATTQTWVEHRCALGAITPAVAKAQGIELAAFADHTGRTRCCTDITRDDIEDWAKHLREPINPRGGYYASSTVVWKFNIVQVFFADLTQREQIPRNPCVGIRLPKRPKPKPSGLSPRQIEAVLRNAHSFRDKTIVKWMLLSGWRPSEVADMRVEHWDPEQQTIWVMRRKSRIEQQYWVVDEMHDTLTAWVTHGLDDPGHGPMWPSTRDGTPIRKDAIGDVWRKAARAAGVKLPPKSARHTFATAHARNGVRTNVLADLMGHADPSSSLVYTASEDYETFLALQDRAPLRAQREPSR